jgi:tryptophan synthase
MSASLPELCTRVRKYAGQTPIAVGFGVNTREHFLSVGNLADGVVIGSKIVSVIKSSPPGKARDAIREYCKEVSRARDEGFVENGVSHGVNLKESIDNAKVDAVSEPTATITRSQEEARGPVDDLEALKSGSSNGTTHFEVICIHTIILTGRNSLLVLASLEDNMSQSHCSTALSN